MIVLFVFAIIFLKHATINGEELQTHSTSINIVCKLFSEMYKEKCNEYYEKNKEKENILIKANANIELQNKNDDKSIECDICKNIINSILNIIKEKTEPEIRRALNMICNNLPDLVQGICHDIVNHFADDIINGIMKNLNANQICQQINLCAPHFKEILNALIFLNHAITKGEELQTHSTSMNIVCRLFPETFKEKCDEFFEKIKENEKLSVNMELQYKNDAKSIQCDICKNLINEIKNTVKEKTEPEIRKALESICNNLPPIAKNICQNVVDSFSDDIVNGIINNLSADEICGKMNLCISQLNDIFNDKNEEDKEDKRHRRKICIRCIHMVMFYERYLNSSLNATQIANKIIDMLSIYKSPVKDMWIKYIKTRGVVIIKRLLKKECPYKICRDLGRCKKRDNYPLDLIKNSETKDSTKCSLCRSISNILKKFFVKTPTKAQVVKALDSVCYFVPSSNGPQCLEFVRSFHDEIGNVLENGKPLNVLCEDLQECLKEKEDNLYFDSPLNLIVNDANSIL